MAKWRYSYIAYPGCTEATLYSKSRAPMSIALCGLAIMLIIASVSSFLTETEMFFEKYQWGNFLLAIAFLTAVVAFAFYAFIWRSLETRYNVEIRFIEQTYRRASMYGDKEHSKSQEVIQGAIARNKKEKAKKDYIKRVLKAAIIYFSIYFAAFLVAVIVIGVI